jgi:hypothetical protein
MSENLTYIDREGVSRTIQGLTTHQNKTGSFWLHCEPLGVNLAYRERSREDMLLSALDSALWYAKRYKEQRDELQEFKDKFDTFIESVSYKEED